MLDPAEESLLEAIRERPDDRHLRKVHADWLEEHGEQALAELVRISAEIATRTVDADRLDRLQKRRAELLLEHAARWPVPVLEFAFRVVEEGQGQPRMWVNVETYPAGADVLARVFPLTEVELSETTRGDERALLPDEVFPPVAANPALAGWTALYLPDSIFSPSGLAILLASPHLTRLRTLDMFESFSGDAVLAWVNAPRWPPLRKLHLNGVVQGDELTAALVRSGHLRGLSELSLIYNEIGDEGAAALAASPDLSGLTLLELYGNEIGDEGALALARSPHLANLRQLDIDSYGAAALSPEVQRTLRERFGDKVSF
jgi:uncharacterized protein (TIGR02996 family)